LLQEIINDLRLEELSPNWNSFNLKNFSTKKYLYQFQENALRNGIKVLWKYYQEFIDYDGNEDIDKISHRKKSFFKCYLINGLNKNLDLKINFEKGRIYQLLNVNYKIEDNRIKYENFINRMSFWMATGSGKTLIIIKLMHILKILINRREIPNYDILFLTHRNDLLEQFKQLVKEYNNDPTNNIHIILKDLKEYSELKNYISILRKNEIIIYYYRSDNISTIQKDKILNYQNYYNFGKWYVFLDEAHKGDRDESIRQHIYSIFSKNGFLFNFSATFTDERDFITCAFEFNLSRFINSGYGKHLLILKQEIRAFRKDEDYTNEEKKAIVLKSLILLTYIKKCYYKIINLKPKIYHKPLLLVLVNTVNVSEADLKLFFRELIKIGLGNIDKEFFNNCLYELSLEFKNKTSFLFRDDESFRIKDEILRNINFYDVLKCVFNSDSPGEIEILKCRSNVKELAFKLKSSEIPFSLIKIGDILKWLNTELRGKAVQVRYKDDSYFQNLNSEDSEINILMGSQSFYEGWDSNRPNIINFINIGIGRNSQKFILQSIGRGIRIEPFKNKRKRLINLINSKEVSFRELDRNLYSHITEYNQSLETLFIIGTSRKTIVDVLNELKITQREDKWKKINNIKISKKIIKEKLLIPTFQSSEKHITENNYHIKFEISNKDLKLLKNYFDFIDDKILLINYEITPQIIKLVRYLIQNPNNFKLIEHNVKNFELLTQRIFDFFKLEYKKFKNFKGLEDEIKHFEEISVNLEYITELINFIEEIKMYPIKIKNLYNEVSQSKISLEEFMDKRRFVKDKILFKSKNQEILIEYFKNHYYNPVIYSQNKRIDFIKHIVNVESEIKFLNDLKRYLSNSKNKFKQFDWWVFSKIDESLDKINIPYYNTNSNQIQNFYPDFIFWMEKNNDYFIVFVDPKGIEHTNWIDKLNGYKILFEEENNPKIFKFNNLRIKVLLLFRTDDINKIKLKFPNYQKYWFDNIEDMLKKVE